LSRTQPILLQPAPHSSQALPLLSFPFSGSLSLSPSLPPFFTLHLSVSFLFSRFLYLPPSLLSLSFLSFSLFFSSPCTFPPLSLSLPFSLRSEERRVGRECSSLWS